MAANPLFRAMDAVLGFPGDVTRGGILSLLGQEHSGLVGGEEFLQGLGVTPTPLRSMATEMAVDPTNLLPLLKLLKGMGKLKGAKASNQLRQTLLAQGAMPEEIARTTALRDPTSGDPLLTMVPEVFRQQGGDIAAGLRQRNAPLAPAYLEASRPLDAMGALPGDDALHLARQTPGTVSRTEGGMLGALENMGIRPGQAFDPLQVNQQLGSQMLERYDAARLMGMADPIRNLEQGVLPDDPSQLARLLQESGLDVSDILPPEVTRQVPAAGIAQDFVRQQLPLQGGQMDTGQLLSEMQAMTRAGTPPAQRSVMSLSANDVDVAVPNVGPYMLGGPMGQATAGAGYDALRAGEHVATGAPVMLPIADPQVHQAVQQGVELAARAARMQDKQAELRQVRDMLRGVGQSSKRPEQALRKLKTELRQVRRQQDRAEKQVNQLVRLLEQRTYRPQVAPALQPETPPDIHSLLGQLVGYHGLHQGAARQ